MTRPQGDDALALSVLTVALVLSAWIVAGGAVRGLVDGSTEGADATGHVVLVVASVVAVVRRRRLASALRDRPGLVFAPALGVLAVAVIVDEPASSSLAAASVCPIGVAAVTARRALVLLLAAVLGTAFVAAVELRTGWGTLEGRELAGALAQAGTYPLAAVAMLAIVGLARSGAMTAVDVSALLPPIRPEPRLLVAGPTPLDAVTPTERRVLEGLCRGLVVKEVALELGIATATVRVHVRSLKRKFAARTLPELVSLATAFGVVR